MAAYTIGEFAELTGLTVHTLRYYEREALMTDVSRDELGRRIYGEAHRVAVAFIRALRDTGMPVTTIRHYMELYREGEHTVDARMRLLQEHERLVSERLDSTQQNLEQIRRKIASYEQALRGAVDH